MLCGFIYSGGKKLIFASSMVEPLKKVFEKENCITAVHLKPAIQKMYKNTYTMKLNVSFFLELLHWK